MCFHLPEVEAAPLGHFPTLVGKCIVRGTVVLKKLVLISSTVHVAQMRHLSETLTVQECFE